MTGEPSGGDHTRWNGDTPAVGDLREMLVLLAPEGALRVIFQRLSLREQGRLVGEHEVIDVIADVEGNLVSVPLTGRVRADPPLARALDEAADRLRGDIAASGADGVDSIEVVLDADGTRQVYIATGLDVTPAEAEERPPHPAVHNGAHHITHYAPVLDDLRDRLAEPPAGPMRRLWDALTDWARRET